MTTQGDPHSPDAGQAATSEPRFQIFLARDCAPADPETVPLHGLTAVDGNGIAAAVEQGFGEGSVVCSVFVDDATGVNLTYAWLKANYPLPRHSHDADCTYVVMSGELLLGTQVLKTGDGFFVPAGHLYRYIAGPQGVEVMEFRTRANYDMRFSGNGESFWSAVAKVSRENVAHWKEQPAPPAARRFLAME